MKVIKSRRYNVWGFVDIFLMVTSEISTINLLTGMVTLKLLLSVLKFGGFVFLVKN